MEKENRNFTIGTAMLRAFPAIMFGVLAVPLMAAQDQDGAAQNQPTTSAQDEAAPNAERTVGAGQITEILKRQGTSEPSPKSAAWCDLNRTRSEDQAGDAQPTEVPGRTVAGKPPQHDNFCARVGQTPDGAAPAAKFKAGKALADTVKRNGNEAQPQSCQSATDTRAGDPVPGIGLPRALGDASVGKARDVAPGQRTAAAPTITHEYHRVGDAAVCPPETPDARSGDSGEN